MGRWEDASSLQLGHFINISGPHKSEALSATSISNHDTIILSRQNIPGHALPFVSQISSNKSFVPSLTYMGFHIHSFEPKSDFSICIPGYITRGSYQTHHCFSCSKSLFLDINCFYAMSTYQPSVTPYYLQIGV